jgi:hypothetical protein
MYDVCNESGTDEPFSSSRRHTSGPAIFQRARDPTGIGSFNFSPSRLLARNNIRFACHPPDERSFVKARLTD